MENPFRLIQEIIALSQAKTWNQAKLEWYLESVYEKVESDTCICGHYPINKISILRNLLNGNCVKVGNVCVNKFMGVRADKILEAFKRISEDPMKSLNNEAIRLAHRIGWLTDWEYDFYSNTWRKRKRISAKQREIKLEINKKLLRHIVNAPSYQ